VIYLSFYNHKKSSNIFYAKRFLWWPCGSIVLQQIQNERHEVLLVDNGEEIFFEIYLKNVFTILLKRRYNCVFEQLFD
jgi:hypothetical protein